MKKLRLGLLLFPLFCFLSKTYTQSASTTPLMLPDPTSASAWEIITKAYHRYCMDSAHQYYAEAFYRQTSRGGYDSLQPSEIKEMFYSVKASNKGILGTDLQQGRYAYRKKTIGFGNFSQYTRLVGFNIALIDSTAKNFFNYSIVRNTKMGERNITEIHFEPTEGNAITGTFLIDSVTGDILQFKCRMFRNDGMFNVVRVLPSSFDRPKPQSQFYEMEYNYAPDSNNQLKLCTIKVDYSGDIIVKRKAYGFKASSVLKLYNISVSPRTELDYTNWRGDDRIVIDTKKTEPSFWKNNTLVRETKEGNDMLYFFEKKKGFRSNVY